MKRFAFETALIAGCALIGAGLVLGLRERPVVYVTSGPEVHSAPKLPVRSEPAAVHPEDDGKRAMLVRQAVESHRMTFVDSCWRPAAKEHPAPAREKFELRFLFDSKGHLASYAVNDPADGQRLDVAKCLRTSRPEISLPAPGHGVTVQLALDLP
jgi:hypothetical protein